MAEVERYTTTLMAGNISISLWWQQTLEGIRASERADGSLTDEREAQYQAQTAPLTDPSFWHRAVARVQRSTPGPAVTEPTTSTKSTRHSASHLRALQHVNRYRASTSR
jgi:hypothetical protein